MQCFSLLLECLEQRLWGNRNWNRAKIRFADFQEGCAVRAPFDCLHVLLGPEAHKMVWQVRLTDHADEALINCNWGFWDGQVTDGCARGKQNCPGWQSGEGQIRRAMLEANLVDCMISPPGH